MSLPLVSAGPSGPSGSGTPLLTKALASSPLALWPMNEIAGTAIGCEINAGNDATISGNYTLQNVTLPDGTKGISFDADSDATAVVIDDVTQLNATVDMDEFAMAVWVKPGASFWGSNHNHYFFDIYGDATARARLYKDWNDNDIAWGYEAGNYGYGVSPADLDGVTDWFLMGLTASDTSNLLRYFAIYYGGAIAYSNQVAMNHSWGAVSIANCTLGNTTSVFESHWGGIALAGIWDGFKTVAFFQDLATIP